MKVLILLAVYIGIACAQNSDTACATEPNGKLVAVPGETAKFYHCDNCIGVLKWCPSGTIFSATNQACIWPNAGCGAGGCATSPPVVTVPPVTTAPPPVTTKPPVTTAPPPVTTAAPPVTTKPPVTTASPATTKPPVSTPPSITGSPEIDCPDLCPNGVYRPFPGDSSKYIVCNQGVDVTMCCPSGLVWNDKLKTCARANSGCGGACP